MVLYRFEAEPRPAADPFHPGFRQKAPDRAQSVILFGLVLVCSLVSPVREFFEQRQIEITDPGRPVIGILPAAIDDVRVFSDPRRLAAAVVWLGHGYVEYAIPNYLTSRDQLEEIRIQVELCSEAPGSAMDWPSDIFFELNGLRLGCWTCPGCYGDHKGIYTPDWVSVYTNSQYGDLIQLVINDSGTFVDGKPISSVNVGQVSAAAQRDFRLRFESPADAKNPGGLTIFGRGYGNYDQHILFTTVASDIKK